MSILKKQLGFTLMELMVAVSIMSLLTTFVVANYSSNEKERNLRQEAGKVLWSIEQAQNMSLTGEVFGGFIPDSYEWQIKNCAIDSCTVLIIAKKADGSLPNNQKTVQTIVLKKVGLSIDNGGSNDGTLVATFAPPRGKMQLTDNQTTIKINIFNEEDSNYCLEGNTISGRLGLSSGICE